MLRFISNKRPSAKLVFLILMLCCGTIFVYYNWNNLKRMKFKMKKTANLTDKLSKLMKPFKVKQFSCEKLFNKDKKEQQKALEAAKRNAYQGGTLPPKRFEKIDCSSFIKERGYITSSLTPEEENFPIAFTIMAYKDIGQVERLFRAIYRPQNAYCIHADKKSPKEFHEGLRRLVKCFPNAMMSSRSVDVRWATYTNLECDLICMKDLLDRFPKWKYLINLTGQEFPLRTNLELVRILKTLNGSNNIIAVPIYNSRVPAKKPSFPVKWIQGAVHITAVRGFIEFLFKDKRALELANLLKGAQHPDETLFGTVNHNPQLKAPGSYLRYIKDNTQDRFITRLKSWSPMRQPCESRYFVRILCIFGIKDLPFLNRQPDLVVNKLYWNFQPLTYDCLEERIFNTTWRDYLGLKPPFSLKFYEKLDSIKNHV